MNKYAHVENGVVTNISNWDGVAKFNPGDGVTMVLADENVRMGGTYDGAFHFVEPDPGPDTRPYDEKRASEYPSVDELVVALWEAVIEERMHAVTQLEIKRQAVKAKYPK